LRRPGPVAKIWLYGTRVDAELHAELLERYAALDEAAYREPGHRQGTTGT